MCGKGSQGGGGMGALGWGGLAPAQQQTIQASPEAMGWYRQAMQMGQQAASKPYQQFGTQASDFVAQLTPAQQQAIGGLGGMAAATQPYASMAPQMAAQAGMTNAAQAAGGYMNPFMQQVVNPVQQALQQQQGQQLSQQQAEAIRGGAFGGERAGIQRDILRGQQQLGMGQALSPLYQAGYGQALGAAQTDLQRQLQAAQGLQGAGIGAQQAALGAATMQQQTGQAGIDALRQQFQQQQMFPYMQAQFLGGLAGGLGPLLGQQTYQARAMTPFGGFFDDGGAVDGDEARMGGAVIDMQPGVDYYRGGVVPRGYATRGAVSYGGDDVGDILKSQAEMYGKEPEMEKMPTGQIQAAKGLEAPNLDTGQQQQKKGLSDITGAAKDIFGLGKDIFSAGKGIYDWASSPSGAAATQGSDTGQAEWPQEYESSGSSQSSKGIMDWLPEIGSAALKAAPYLAAAFLKDGGAVDRHGYATDGGVMPSDDIFERGVLGAESRGRQFDRSGNVLTSPKGALGIAQIMPGTAPEAARLAGMEYSADRLRSDPEYNKALGRAYYNEQLRKFGSPELASAAYNAGPGRVQSALRQAAATGRDVMSFLPAETRAYVPRVMEMAGRGGLDQARAGLASSRKEIPLTDPRRSFMALDQSKEAPKAEGGLGGLLTEQNVIPALMGLGKGLSAMMSAKTVSPGAALASGLGEGLAGGAESYLGTQKTLAEIPKTEAEAEERRQLAKRAAAETATEMARTGQVEALTKQIGAGTEKTYAEIAGNSIIDIGGRTYVRFVDPSTGSYKLMTFQEWNALDPSQRPTIDPRLEQIGREVETTKPPVPTPGKAPAPAPAPGGMPESPSTKAPEAVSMPSDWGQKAAQITKLKSGWSRERQAQEPDFFTPQDEIARSVEEQKQNIIPLAGALAALPRDKSVMASGKQQEVLKPIVGYLTGVARVIGREDLMDKIGANPEALANSEEVSKLMKQMQQAAAASGNMHAYAAFRDMAEGIPSILNSPGGQARLIAQILTNNQRQLDKNKIFSDWQRDAAGPGGRNSEWAKLSSREANRAFDSTFTNAYYAKDRDNLEKMFNYNIGVTDESGQKRKMSLLEALAKYPSNFSSEDLAKINAKYPNALRYFGINQ